MVIGFVETIGNRVVSRNADGARGYQAF